MTLAEFKEKVKDLINIAYENLPVPPQYATRAKNDAFDMVLGLLKIVGEQLSTEKIEQQLKEEIEKCNDFCDGLLKMNMCNNSFYQTKGARNAYEHCLTLLKENKKLKEEL